MNAITKVVLEKAVVFPKIHEKRDAALDIMFDKLIVIPIQKAWRSKTPQEKAVISMLIKNSMRECICCYKSRRCGRRCLDSDSGGD